MADKPVISINNLSAFYGKKQVLDRISFELTPGTVTAIAGPNGSGKSTLLSLIANIKIPELSSTADDSIIIYDKKFADYSRKELSRTVAYAPQNSYPAWNNTVYNTIMTGRYAHTNWTDTYTQNDNSVVIKTINTLNLNSLADRNVFSLSGGEYQRVVLARSLAQEPQILLLDEPVSSLDLYYQYLLLETIQNLAKTEKLSVLISLHDLNLASIFSDRIILLSEGHLLSDGTAEQVLTPSNLEQIYKQKFIVTAHPTRHKPQVFVE